MEELEKYELINHCTSGGELKDAIIQIGDSEQGKIQGMHRKFDAKKMASYVHMVIHESAPANLLTRSYGIRQQAIYLRYKTGKML